MKILPLTTVVFACSLIVLIGYSSASEGAASASQQQPLVVFIVRHGEKADDGEDPELSAEGQERARLLAKTLRSAAIEQVHSSDFIRTRDTAAPTAKASGLDVQLYDPRNLPDLAEKLRAIGGRHLVVGHSNTTPPMVELLGGEPSLPIDEEAEFDRLYIVTVGRDGTATSVMMRYGDYLGPAPN